MKFALHICEANISHLRSKYFTAQLFHLPEGQISLKKRASLTTYSFFLEAPPGRRQVAYRRSDSARCVQNKKRHTIAYRFYFETDTQNGTGLKLLNFFNFQTHDQNIKYQILNCHFAYNTTCHLLHKKYYYLHRK